MQRSNKFLIRHRTFSLYVDSITYFSLCIDIRKKNKLVIKIYFVSNFLVYSFQRVLSLKKPLFVGNFCTQLLDSTYVDLKSINKPLRQYIYNMILGNYFATYLMSYLLIKKLCSYIFGFLSSA